MKKVSNTNTITNNRIQELAVRVIDRNNEFARRDMNELMSLIMPKLKFYIWNFVPNDDDTKDVLLNTMEKICLNIHRYRPEYRFTTWSYTIAKNEALSWLEETRENDVSLDDCFYMVANSVVDTSNETFETEMQCENVISDIYDEIQRISVDEDNLMLLEKDINQRKYCEIAEIYEMSENTAKTRVRAGRKRVRVSIFKKHPDLAERMTVLEL